MTSISCIIILFKFVFRSLFFSRGSWQASLLMFKGWSSTWNRRRTCCRLWLPSRWFSFIFRNISSSKFRRVWMYWTRSRSVVTDCRWVNARVGRRWRGVVITYRASKPRAYACAVTSICCATTTFQKTWSWWKRDRFNNPFWSKISVRSSSNVKECNC